MTYLTIVFFSLLSVALIAFGWFPCCCTGITNNCCSGVSIPRTLTATVASAACACFDGVTISLVWDGAKWVGSHGNLSCDGGVATHQLKLSCDFPPFSGWVMETLEGFSGGGCSFGAVSIDTVSSTCSPFSLVFTGNVADAGGCSCTGDAFTITVTP